MCPASSVFSDAKDANVFVTDWIHCPSNKGTRERNERKGRRTLFVSSSFRPITSSFLQSDSRLVPEFPVPNSYHPGSELLSANKTASIKTQHRAIVLHAIIGAFKALLFSLLSDALPSILNATLFCMLAPDFIDLPLSIRAKVRASLHCAQLDSTLDRP